MYYFFAPLYLTDIQFSKQKIFCSCLSRGLNGMLYEEKNVKKISRVHIGKQVNNSFWWMFTWEQWCYLFLIKCCWTLHVLCKPLSENFGSSGFSCYFSVSVDIFCQWHRECYTNKCNHWPPVETHLGEKLCCGDSSTLKLLIYLKTRKRFYIAHHFPLCCIWNLYPVMILLYWPW